MSGALCAAGCAAVTYAGDGPAPTDAAEDAVADVVTDAPLPDVQQCDASVERGWCVSYEVSFACGLPSGYTPGAFTARCQELCQPYLGASPIPIFSCRVTAATPSSLAHLSCDPGCPAEGRRPAGFTLPALVEGSSAAQRFFSSATTLEHVSVAAFEHLAAELRAQGAPASLVERARRSAQEERRHTEAMLCLARREGCEPERPELPRGPLRPLFEVALENALEGCVRESFGALLAHWQSERARDAEVRLLVRGIARDETRHAQLAWDVAVWAEALLAPSQREELALARWEAWEALSREWARGYPEEDRLRLGLPTEAQARRLLATLREALEARAA